MIRIALSLLVWLIIPHRTTPPDMPDPAVHRDLSKDFQSPIHRDISLSGTFGELRPNHFHAGLDIKSATGRSGEPVYATARGYISRIKISAYGYGHALYIQHPNGHMSVYGHLDRFIPSLENYILKEHYRRKRFELDLMPAPGTYPVTQGQVIAYMGNTGSSTGPHLHFEIRNSSTEEVLNPLDYGIPLKDNEAPKIYTIKLYTQDQNMALPLMTLPVSNETQGSYRLSQDTIVVNGMDAALAIRTYDQLPQNNSKLGVYGIRMYADNELRYQFDMHALDFDEMRYSNAHRDYEEEIKNNQLFHRLYRLAGNKLRIYPKSIDDGWITLSPNSIKKIRLEVYDYAGNISTLSFYLKQGIGPFNTLTGGARYVAHDQPYSLEDQNMKAELPANILYSDVYLDYSAETIDRAYSDLYKIHDSTIPLHRSYALTIKPLNLPPQLKKKAIIARYRGSHITNVGGKWNGEWLETEVNSFGNFAVTVDTIAPTIKPIAFKTNMKKSHLMSFKIKDNFGVSGKADELAYNGYIDGEWVLMELDSKNDVITHRFDGRTKPGRHQVKIQVRDDKGNERIYVQSFLK